MPGTLYVVATPLGNLRDITLRALDILGTADVVAAEDTRVTSVLLRHFGIDGAAPVAARAQRGTARPRASSGCCVEGRSVALVSDAGTPAVSDPGARLVRAVRDAGFPVVPIPGANAAIAAVSAAGLDARSIRLSRIPARECQGAPRTRWSPVAALPCALVILRGAASGRRDRGRAGRILGGERELVVARELTKKFETIARMPLVGGRGVVRCRREPRARRIRAARRCAAAGRRTPPRAASLAPDAERWLRALLDELPPARAARLVAAVSGEPRDLVCTRARWR